MTQRSIQAGTSPTVIVRAGTDVQLEGWEDEHVRARAAGRWGLKLERVDQSATGHIRARAKIGDRVLFDVRRDLLKRKKNDLDDQTEAAIQVESGAEAVVRVPYGSSVVVYSGGSADVRAVRGSVTVYSGRDVRLSDVQTLVHVSAGGSLNLECANLAGDDVKFSAGRDLRFYVRQLDDAKVIVDDLGGCWEAIIGNGRRQIRLEAGGDVTLVTDRVIAPGSPDGVLGHIEAPQKEASQQE